MIDFTLTDEQFAIRGNTVRDSSPRRSFREAEVLVREQVGSPDDLTIDDQVEYVRAIGYMSSLHEGQTARRLGARDEAMITRRLAR